MIQGAKTQKAGSRMLQIRLDERIQRAKYLNIQFAAMKVELMHLIPHTNNVMGARDITGITLYDVPVAPKTSIKSRGVWIDHRLSFKVHAATAAANRRRSAGFLWRIVKRKGITPRTLHHLAMTTTVPPMLRGSEAWWTGAQHILGQLATAYNTMARIITGLPKWTPMRFLLQEAGMPPLEYLLDLTSQWYGIRVLLNPDDHPCKQRLLSYVK